MSLGYVEELALRYFEKKGYLVVPNVQFQLDKQATGKTVAGWSDIDLLAVKPSEVLVVQCKSMLGSKKAEEEVSDIRDWFDRALAFLEADDRWRGWCEGGDPRKLLVVDFTVKKAEPLLEQEHIEVLRYEDLLTELLQILASPAGKMKETDCITRLLCAMLDKGLVDKSKLAPPA